MSDLINLILDLEAIHPTKHDADQAFRDIMKEQHNFDDALAATTLFLMLTHPLYKTEKAKRKDNVLKVREQIND